MKTSTYSLAGFVFGVISMFLASKTICLNQDSFIYSWHMIVSTLTGIASVGFLTAFFTSIAEK